MDPFWDFASQPEVRRRSGLTVYSGATVLESHQIPMSIDYPSIVSHAPPSHARVPQSGGHRLGDRRSICQAYSAGPDVPAAPA